MKLKKNLIITSILAISVFVSTTSYAADKEKPAKPSEPAVMINQDAINKMADKVNGETIFAEEGQKVPEEEGKDKDKTENKPVEENPNKKPENPESTEGSAESSDPQSQGNPEKVEDGKDKAEQEKDPSKAEDDKKENKLPENTNQSVQNGSSNTEGQDVQNNNVNNPESSNELMNRLNNIKSNEEAQEERLYIGDENPKTGTLERLTSKETLTTSFKDKGSNLRLNLANTSDDNKADNTKYIIKPQTLIILIAILAAIFSAISIAIRGRGSSKKDS